MKWNEEKIEQLKSFCSQSLSNKDIATHFGCSVADVYAKRSQLGITINKCRSVAKPNPAFEKAFPEGSSVSSRGLTRDVKAAFSKLHDAILIAIASDWTNEKDAAIYSELSVVVNSIENAFAKVLSLKTV